MRFFQGGNFVGFLRKKKVPTQYDSVIKDIYDRATTCAKTCVCMSSDFQ